MSFVMSFICFIFSLLCAAQYLPLFDCHSLVSCMVVVGRWEGKVEATDGVGKGRWRKLGRWEGRWKVGGRQVY